MFPPVLTLWINHVAVGDPQQHGDLSAITRSSPNTSCEFPSEVWRCVTWVAANAMARIAKAPPQPAGMVMDFLLNHDRDGAIWKLFYPRYMKTCHVEGRGEHRNRDVVERGRGEKWLKPEGNKVQKVQLGPEVISSPYCWPGSAATASAGTWSVHGSHSVCILDMH